MLLESAAQIYGLGGVLRPRVEGGLRYDGGDAETGRGFEVGGGLGWARGALTLDVNGRMLVAHADESYEEWGYGGSLVFEPGDDNLGLQMRVGAAAGAMADVAHPGVAGIHGIESWRGRSFLLVEYFAGGTLADRIRKGPVPEGEAVRTVAALADALEGGAVGDRVHEREL